MSDTLVYSGVLQQLNCFCGIRFAVPKSLWETHRYGKFDQDIYCPLGHNPTWRKHYRDDLKGQRERAERLEASLTHERDQREAAERTARALRGHLTRLRRRIAAGVCPWCQRSFTNVLRHVDTKHPEHSVKAHKAVSA